MSFISIDLSGPMGQIVAGGIQLVYERSMWEVLKYFHSQPIAVYTCKQCARWLIYSYLSTSITIMKISKLPQDSDKANLTPMIDVVFLLLIFFMVTTSLIKEEADLGVQLPTPTRPAPPVELSDNHIIDIMPDGSVHLNGGLIDSGQKTTQFEGLADTLRKLKASSDRMQMKTVVLVQADPVSPHYKAMQVLDACAASDIKYVSFAKL